MRNSPFTANPVLAARWGQLRPSLGTAFSARLADLRDGPGSDRRHPAAVIPAAVVAELVTEFNLTNAREAALLSLYAAASLAKAPISGYRVGVAGIGALSGDLLLGGNLEFPNASIAHTIHAEGFATLLARARGEHLAVLASTQARPCAHCRQVLAEMDGAWALQLIDPQGHELRLADLFPWPFAPGDLGEVGARAAESGSLALRLDATADDVPGEIAAALKAASGRAHAPYSRDRSVIVLRLSDGSLVDGAVLESVAFNPTIGPLADALVGLNAAGRGSAAIRDAWLGIRRGAIVNHEAPTRDLLAAVAPTVRLQTTYWA
jgi:cytidine deaminase